MVLRWGGMAWDGWFRVGWDGWGGVGYTFSNSAVNPAVYAGFNDNFKRSEYGVGMGWVGGGSG